MAPTRSTDQAKWATRWAKWETVAAMLSIAVSVYVVHGLLAQPAATKQSADGVAVADEARAPHGPVDAGFSQDMSLHHEQALLLSRLVIAHGTPRLRPVAEAIINQQLKEIGYMQGWLMLWGEPRLSASDDMKWAREAYVRSQQREPAYDQLIESCVKDKAMPGLASPEEIEAFEKLRSPDAVDQTYLTLMIRHHQGAIIMARFASDHAESSVVRAFARSMGAEQQNEIRQMATMLRSLSQPDHHIS